MAALSTLHDRHAYYNTKKNSSDQLLKVIYQSYLFDEIAFFIYMTTICKACGIYFHLFCFVFNYFR